MFKTRCPESVAISLQWQLRFDRLPVVYILVFVYHLPVDVLHSFRDFVKFLLTGVSSTNRHRATRAGGCGVFLWQFVLARGAACW